VKKKREKGVDDLRSMCKNMEVKDGTIFTLVKKKLFPEMGGGVRNRPRERRQFFQSNHKWGS